MWLLIVIEFSCECCMVKHDHDSIHNDHTSMNNDHNERYSNTYNQDLIILLKSSTILFREPELTLAISLQF